MTKKSKMTLSPAMVVELMRKNMREIMRRDDFDSCEFRSYGEPIVCESQAELYERVTGRSSASFGVSGKVVTPEWADTLTEETLVEALTRLASDQHQYVVRPERIIVPPENQRTLASSFGLPVGKHKRQRGARGRKNSLLKSRRYLT